MGHVVFIFGKIRLGVNNHQAFKSWLQRVDCVGTVLVDCVGTVSQSKVRLCRDCVGLCRVCVTE